MKPSLEMLVGPKIDLNQFSKQKTLLDKLNYLASHLDHTSTAESTGYLRSLTEAVHHSKQECQIESEVSR